MLVGSATLPLASNKDYVTFGGSGGIHSVQLMVLFELLSLSFRHCVFRDTCSRVAFSANTKFRKRVLFLNNNP